MGIFCWSGCTTSAVCQTSAAGQPAESLLFFQKTPCYGTCPAYDAMIYANGSITYTGYRYAPVQDTVQFCLPKQDLQQLKKDIEALHYTSLQDNYRAQRTDMPSTYLTFYKEGREAKRIRHQQGGPEALLQFKGKVEQLFTDLLAKKLAAEQK
ncbi:DUF6438 domain-containing protein [Pontibacter chitinilyticus]|uniref:DUF6438 domain-containing protein n=1 Tax=Pontibacter chitinilyticus TaxID=2674989 RepID=UPI00321991AB